MRLTDEQIFILLRDDLRRARAQGHPIDMRVTGITSQLTILLGERVYQARSPKCAMCVAGARLLGRVVKTANRELDLALTVGRSAGWGAGFFYGSSPGNTAAPYSDKQYLRGFRMGRKMVSWVAREQQAGRL